MWTRGNAIPTPFLPRLCFSVFLYGLYIDIICNTNVIMSSRTSIAFLSHFLRKNTDYKSTLAVSRDVCMFIYKKSLVWIDPISFRFQAWTTFSRTIRFRLWSWMAAVLPDSFDVLRPFISPSLSKRPGLRKRAHSFSLRIKTSVICFL